MTKAALYQKMVKVMNEVGQLNKDGTVTDFTGKKMYSYLSEEQTTAELQQAFIKHGLVLFPVKVEDELVYIESVKKTGELIRAPITRVRVTYKVCDTDTGEFEELQSIGYGSDSQDKGSNKAMTGAFKYVQRQTFMISTGDDGDHTPSAELDKEHSKPTPTYTKPPQEKPQAPAGPSNQSITTPYTNQPKPSEQPPAALLSQAQLNMIKKLTNDKKVSTEQYRQLIAPKTSTTELTSKEASNVISRLQKLG